MTEPKPGYTALHAARDAVIGKAVEVLGMLYRGRGANPEHVAQFQSEMAGVLLTSAGDAELKFQQDYPVPAPSTDDLREQLEHLRARDYDADEQEAADGRAIGKMSNEIEALKAEVARLRQNFQHADSVAKFNHEEWETTDDECTRLRAQIAELTRERDKLIGTLSEEVAWQREKYRDSHDRSALGRLIGMEDALRSVREALEVRKDQGVSDA